MTDEVAQLEQFADQFEAVREALDDGAVDEALELLLEVREKGVMDRHLDKCIDVLRTDANGNGVTIVSEWVHKTLDRINAPSGQVFEDLEEMSSAAFSDVNMVPVAESSDVGLEIREVDDAGSDDTGSDDAGPDSTESDDDRDQDAGGTDGDDGGGLDDFDVSPETDPFADASFEEVDSEEFSEGVESVDEFDDDLFEIVEEDELGDVPTSITSSDEAEADEAETAPPVEGGDEKAPRGHSTPVPTDVAGGSPGGPADGVDEQVTREHSTPTPAADAADPPAAPGSDGGTARLGAEETPATDIDGAASGRSTESESVESESAESDDDDFDFDLGLENPGSDDSAGFDLGMGDDAAAGEGADVSGESVDDSGLDVEGVDDEPDAQRPETAGEGPDSGSERDDGLDLDFGDLEQGVESDDEPRAGGDEDALDLDLEEIDDGGDAGGDDGGPIFADAESASEQSGDEQSVELETQPGPVDDDETPVPEGVDRRSVQELFEDSFDDPGDEESEPEAGSPGTETDEGGESGSSDEFSFGFDETDNKTTVGERADLIEQMKSGAGDDSPESETTETSGGGEPSDGSDRDETADGPAGPAAGFDESEESTTVADNRGLVDKLAQQQTGGGQEEPSDAVEDDADVQDTPTPVPSGEDEGGPSLFEDGELEGTGLGFDESSETRVASDEEIEVGLEASSAARDSAQGDEAAGTPEGDGLDEGTSDVRYQKPDVRPDESGGDGPQEPDGQPSEFQRDEKTAAVNADDKEQFMSLVESIEDEEPEGVGHDETTGETSVEREEGRDEDSETTMDEGEATGLSDDSMAGSSVVNFQSEPETGTAGEDNIDRSLARQNEQSSKKLSSGAVRLVEEAERLFEKGHTDSAHDLIQSVLDSNPDSERASELLEAIEAEQEPDLIDQVGGLEAVPEREIDMGEVADGNFDHRYGFVLSLVDGQVRIEDILELSSMSRAETLTVLSKMLDQGIVSLK